MSLTTLSEKSNIIWILVTLLVNFQCSFGQDLANETYTDDLILKLYEKYKEAVLEETETNPMRRFYDESKQYQIHVEKLKEVNGYKRHNLFIKQSVRNGESEMIYIINPLESRFPHPYLSLDEFKDALLKRSEKIRQTEGTTKIFGKTTKYVLKKKVLTPNTNKTVNNTTTKKIEEKKSVTKTTNNDIKSTFFIPTRTRTKALVATTGKKYVKTQVDVINVTKEVVLSPQTVVTSTPVQVEILNTTESTIKIEKEVTNKVEDKIHITDTTKKLLTENASVEDKESTRESKNTFVTTNRTLLVTAVSTTEKPTENDVVNATSSIITTIANDNITVKDIARIVQTINTTETAITDEEEVRTITIADVQVESTTIADVEKVATTTVTDLEKAETTTVAYVQKVETIPITDTETISDSPEVKTTTTMATTRRKRFTRRRVKTTTAMATTRSKKLTRRTRGRPMVFIQ